MARSVSVQLTGTGRRFAVAVARFNGHVVEGLVAGAIDCLLRHGVKDEDITIVRVPGAWELPVVVKKLAEGKKHHAIIALGCVIRGETPHFDYVAGECAKGIASAAANTDIAISFGVLTTDTIEQALERAGCKSGNKGFDAALAAIELANLRRALTAPKKKK